MTRRSLDKDIERLIKVTEAAGKKVREVTITTKVTVSTVEPSNEEQDKEGWDNAINSAEARKRIS
jgi:hypothetical protein